MDAANSMLTNKYITEKGLKAFVPFYRVFRKGVLYRIPDDMSIPEAIEAINANNPGLNASEGY